MQGLKKEEIQNYLASRLKVAIYSVSKGVPRLVNNLATASLMYACAKRQQQIDEETVYQGQKDFEI